MLDYLGNLMEDASDFSWEAAKASHAIALTNMEADRLKWTDTDKLDRIRRAHAQRHALGQTANSKVSLLKNKKIIIQRMESFVYTSKKGHVNLLPIIELLVNILGMFVSHVMVPMLNVCVLRNQIHKTSIF